MLGSARHTDVVIVRAGLAGLAAAHQLTSAGLTVRVLEAEPRVGGRMTTDDIDGFRLDRTGEFLNTSFPELRRTPGLGELPLRPLSPGVLVHGEGRTHRMGEPRGTGGAFSTARGWRRRPARRRARPGPARRRPQPARGGADAPAPRAPRAPDRRVPDGPWAAISHHRRLPAPTADRAALLPGADHLKPLRRPGAARIRPRPAVAGRGRRRRGPGAAGGPVAARDGCAPAYAPSPPPPPGWPPPSTAN